jgi:diguanylate cyclase (GGDEF)-like protein/PAS domain S-box-containing protein
MANMNMSTSSNPSVGIQRLRDALNNVPAYVYMKDTSSHYTYGNKMTLQLFDCTEAELIGRDDSQFFQLETVTKLREVDLRVLQGECTEEEIIVVKADGSRNVFLEVETPIYDEAGGSTIVGILGVSTDITHRMQLDDELKKAALTDELTHLPNRRLLLDRLKQALLNSYRQISYGAVLFLDLDKFNQTNEIHDQKTRDRVLIEVAKRLRKIIRNADTVARVDADEFVVLLEGLGSEFSNASEYADMIASKIHESLSEQYIVGEIRLHCAVSLGIRVFLGEVDPNEVLKDADTAMRKSKSSIGR